MSEHLIIGLTAITFLAISAQWAAWRLKLPSILILLLAGFLVGPILGLLHPDHLLGDLLYPVVSLSVAIILFEGGLSLKIAELKEIGGAVRNLITVAILITWVIVALAAHFVAGFSAAIAILYGAILVVTGPTVIIPLLQQIRPSRRVGSLARWEGIVNDPLGAILAVLVLEAILVGGFPKAIGAELLSILKTVLAALFWGGASAVLLIVLLKNFLIPDHLEEVVTLMLVIVSFTAANLIQRESGLLVVTIFGIILANQKYVSIKHIITFKENLSVLLIAGLFIILSARLDLSVLQHIGLREFAFVAILILIARPVAIYLSTLGTELNWREKTFLAFLAPRGIVAAAVTSLFSFTLVEVGYSEAERFIPLTFFVIICTVTFYGLLAAPLARRLGVAKKNPQGVLFVGAHDWARQLAAVLHKEGLDVLVVDTNYQNISEARMLGLQTFHGSILSENVSNDLDLSGIGKLFALTVNDEVNALAGLHFSELFGRAEIYQLSCDEKGTERDTRLAKEQRSRLLFSAKAHFNFITSLFDQGAVVKKTSLTKDFDYQAYQRLHGDNALPLFVITEAKTLFVYTVDRPLFPKPGQTLISLVRNT